MIEIIAVVLASLATPKRWPLYATGAAAGLASVLLSSIMAGNTGQTVPAFVFLFQPMFGLVIAGVADGIRTLVRRFSARPQTDASPHPSE